jgi:DNA replication and repair protein RecF
VQTFITATGIEGLNADKLKGASLYHVHDGTVEL